MLSGTVSTIDTGGFELRGGITPPGLMTQTDGLRGDCSGEIRRLFRGVEAMTGPQEPGGLS